MSKSESENVSGNQADNYCGICGDGGHTAWSCPNQNKPKLTKVRED